MSLSFAVTDGHGRPLDHAVLDRQVDFAQRFLSAQFHPDVVDIDVDASLARGEVTFSALVEAANEDEALIRMIGVVVPAIRATGGVPHLGQTILDPDHALEVWRPRDLAPGVGPAQPAGARDGATMRLQAAGGP